MIPGMNPRQMQQAMKRMGIKQQQVDAAEVVIKLNDGREIVINEPSVTEVNMMGQKTLQITGEQQIREIDTTPSISDEDVQTVVDQSGCTKEEAQKAIEDHNGDLAEAIMSLQSE